MSDQAPASKTDDANLKLLANLEQRNVVERTYIPREVYTGGEYRAKMTKLADAMVAVGGGKGTYSAGTAMTALRKPVLPLDLDVGATTDDGSGAVALHLEMMSNTDRFFPNTHPEVKNKLGLLSLNRGPVEPESAAPGGGRNHFRGDRSRRARPRTTPSGQRTPFAGWGGP